MQSGHYVTTVKSYRYGKQPQNADNYDDDILYVNTNSHTWTEYWTFSLYLKPVKLC